MIQKNGNEKHVPASDFRRGLWFASRFPPRRLEHGAGGAPTEDRNLRRPWGTSKLANLSVASSECQTKAVDEICFFEGRRDLFL